MEALVKKKVSVEFEGKKYSIQDDASIEDLLSQLGMPTVGPVKLQPTKDGFVLIP